MSETYAVQPAELDKGEQFDLVGRKLLHRLLPDETGVSGVESTIVQCSIWALKRDARDRVTWYRANGWYVSHCFPCRYKFHWLVIAMRSNEHSAR